jgi:hypothetical protein
VILPTVKVKREGGKGYRLINQADFDPARHELADQALQPSPARGTPDALAGAAAAEPPKRRGRPPKERSP